MKCYPSWTEADDQRERDEEHARYARFERAVEDAWQAGLAIWGWSPDYVEASIEEYVRRVRVRSAR